MKVDKINSQIVKSLIKHDLYPSKPLESVCQTVQNSVQDISANYSKAVLSIENKKAEIIKSVEEFLKEQVLKPDEIISRPHIVKKNGLIRMHAG